MKISGNVENIIFSNIENGYCVFEVDTKELPVVMVGNFLNLTQGMYIEAEGEFKETKYGEQFFIKTANVSFPKSLEGIKRYLSSGLIKGVGEVTANSIVEKFKQDTMDIIEFNPARLSEIRGISDSKAISIGQSVAKLKSMEKEVMFLQNYGIGINMAIKIYNQYKEKTQSVLSKNPYKLIEDVDGIGFKTADKIALSLGIESDSDFRLKAALIYALKENCLNFGGTYISKEDLIKTTTELLGLEEIESEKAEKLIQSLIYDNYFIEYKNNDTTGIALKEFYNIEKSIATKLVKLDSEFDKPDFSFENDILNFEKFNNVKFDALQKSAILNAMQNGVSIITGGPGTGKTTIIKAIIYLLKNIGIEAVLCAPTGRAAKRLSLSSDIPAKTIHRLLEINFSGGNFVYNEQNKLEAKAIICDEVSMVDINLMNSLLKAVKSGSRLVLVGDADQLPSVSCGNVLSDIIESNIFNVFTLNKIFRQTDNSNIIVNAHKINSGEMPKADGKDSDFFIINQNEPEKMLQTVCELVSHRLPNFLSVNSFDIQVLAPLKKGVCGVENLNLTLQNLLNNAKHKQEYKVGNYTFKAGDKVMQTVNNYQLEWLKSSECGLGVFNGDIGEIVKISELGEVTVMFDDRKVVSYDRTNLDELTLAYAISIHKSQGSEFDAVIIPLSMGHPRLFTKNLLYTAVTRAKRLVVIIGASYSIRRMVENDYIESRCTMLKDMLLEAEQNFKKINNE